jgi:ribosomal protein S18 acetylase RimI-like enzyme
MMKAMDDRKAMSVVIRPATQADEGALASLLTELGYPATAASVRERLAHSLDSATSFLLVATVAGEVSGMISVELVPYFPTGTTICRITSLVVAKPQRGRGIGDELLGAAADFARRHRCSALELTSAPHRVEAHRFYEQRGFSRTGFRFFQSL